MCLTVLGLARTLIQPTLTQPERNITCARSLLARQSFLAWPSPRRPSLRRIRAVTAGRAATPPRLAAMAAPAALAALAAMAAQPRAATAGTVATPVQPAGMA